MYSKNSKSPGVHFVMPASTYQPEKSSDPEEDF